MLFRIAGCEFGNAAGDGHWQQHAAYRQTEQNVKQIKGNPDKDKPAENI